MSRSVWSASSLLSLLALSCGWGVRQREQAPRTPYASRGTTPGVTDVAKRLECVQLAQLAGAVVRLGRWTAGASFTHSIRFARNNARGDRCREAFGVRPACSACWRCRAAGALDSGSKLHALHTLREEQRQG